MRHRMSAVAGGKGCLDVLMNRECALPLGRFDGCKYGVGRVPLPRVDHLRVQHDIGRVLVAPLELHEGYILAEERILTNTSGNFGWGDDSQFEVHVYGPDGLELADFEAPVVEQDGARFVELRLPRDHMAAIVRR